MEHINRGVWPTLITPYTRDDRIDYDAVEKIVDWHIERGVAGIFAVCQSSEMFHLTLPERIELARRIVAQANGRIQIIASGHISEHIEDQVRELNEMAETGIDALVLLTNRFTAADGDEDEWFAVCENMLKSLPADLALGMYECPHPFRYDLSPELLKRCADTGRFVFLKDTCSNPDIIRTKIEAVRNTGLGVYNANAASLLQSLRMGAVGFSGVMANFHPELYAWLCEHWADEPERAEALQVFLGLASLAECQRYPNNAKYYLKLKGIPIEVRSRKPGMGDLSPSQRLEMGYLATLSDSYIDAYCKS